MSKDTDKDVVLSRDGFYQVTGNVSEGDMVEFQLGDRREFTGEVQYINDRQMRRNDIVVLEVSVDEGYLNIESGGRVVKHVEGEDPDILGRVVGDVVLV